MQPNRLRVVQHDDRSKLKLEPGIEIKDPAWLRPALYLIWSLMSAVIAWLILIVAEMVIHGGMP